LLVLTPIEQIDPATRAILAPCSVTEAGHRTNRAQMSLHRSSLTKPGPVSNGGHLHAEKIGQSVASFSLAELLLNLTMVDVISYITGHSMLFAPFMRRRC
jgi:hypothetical protein